MDVIRQLADFISKLLRFSYIVQPWERGVRVRLGKHITVHSPGIHFIIPLVDTVYVQNTRGRVMHASTQTISTLDGRPLSVAGSLQYRVDDVLLLYRTLHQAEAVIQTTVSALIAQYIMTHPIQECSPQQISLYVNHTLELSLYGIADAEFFITDCVYVKTYRLIQDSMAQYNMESLNTQRSRGDNNTMPM